jgi:hypothetical protein
VIDGWYRREQGYRAQIAALTAALHRLAAADEPFAASDDSAPGPGDETAARAAFASEQLAALGLAGLAAFSVFADEDGEIHLVCPAADTIGCLYMPAVSGSDAGGNGTATLGELILAACAHTGLAAGQAHAELARATGQTDEGPDNDGNPVIYSAAAAPGGWVCAVPVTGNPDWICGYPVESEPCPDHRRPGWQPERAKDMTRGRRRGQRRVRV